MKILAHVDAFLIRTPIAHEVKEKIDKWDYIK
jgi:hypothetical protein